MTKMLFMLTLLLLSAQSHAQFTGAVWSGTRVSAPSGGEYITLPGCSTQTQIMGTSYIKNDMITWGNWRNAQFYTDSSIGIASEAFLFSCAVWIFNNSWSYPDAKYISIFADVDKDGVYEELISNNFLLTTDSSFGQYQPLSYFGYISDTGRFRMIAHDVPISTGCPAAVNGLVVDGYALISPECQTVVCDRNIYIPDCMEYDSLCIAEGVIPITGVLGGQQFDSFYNEKNVQLEYTPDDGMCLLSVDLSGWDGWNEGNSVEAVVYYYDEYWDFAAYQSFDINNPTGEFYIDTSVFGNKFRVVFAESPGIPSECPFEGAAYSISYIDVQPQTACE